MATRTYEVTVRPTEVRLLPHQFDALASEFCGQVNSTIGLTSARDAYVVTFTTKANQLAFELVLPTILKSPLPSGSPPSQPPSSHASPPSGPSS